MNTIELDIHKIYACRVGEIFELYERYGKNDYIGENISILSHSIQTAMMAEQYTNNSEIILAAFFHDIGHLVGFMLNLKQMDDLGTLDHDKIGASYLRHYKLPEQLCQLVENHVSAKRYLVSKDVDVDGDYMKKLSKASQETLNYQGGPMTIDEQIKYEQDPLKDMYVKFRQWEEKSKECIPLNELNSIDYYRQMTFDLFMNLK